MAQHLAHSLQPLPSVLVSLALHLAQQHWVAPALAQSVDPSDLIPVPLPVQDLPHRQGRLPLDPLLPLDLHHRLTTRRRLDLQAVHFVLIEILLPGLNQIDHPHLNR